jgi:hypothetical protein
VTASKVLRVCIAAHARAFRTLLLPPLFYPYVPSPPRLLFPRRVYRSPPPVHALIDVLLLVSCHPMCPEQHPGVREPYVTTHGFSYAAPTQPVHTTRAHSLTPATNPPVRHLTHVHPSLPHTHACYIVPTSPLFSCTPTMSLGNVPTSPLFSCTPTLARPPSRTHPFLSATHPGAP